MSRWIPLLFFLFPLTLLGQLTGYETEALVLKTGKVYRQVTVQDLTPNSVILRQENALIAVPAWQLPDALRERAEEELENRPEAEPSAPSENPYQERRLQEIEANREAERQIAIARAENPPETGTPASVTPPQWNDLLLLGAEFGCDHGIFRVQNTGGTTRQLQSWDFQIIYSDGTTRHPQFLKPNRISRETFGEFSFRVPDLGYRIPRYVQFAEGEGRVLPVDRNCLEVDGGFTHRRHYPHPGRSKKKDPPGRGPLIEIED